MTAQDDTTPQTGNPPAPTTPATPSEKERMDSRRSAVRLWVTYIAAAFVFGVGTLMILWFTIRGGDNGATSAKDLFVTILPVGTAVVTYWFAGRSAEKAGQSK